MKILSYILLLALFVGCSDDYLDVLPKGQAIPENTDQLAEMLNVTADFNGHGGAFNHVTDQVWGASFLMDGIQIAKYTWADYPYDEVTDDPHWNALYQCIGIANFVLENIDTATPGNEYDAAETKSRALFARANAYFVLVNSYAKHYNASTAVSDLGVPILLNFDMQNQEPRATVKQVYDQIFADLEACLDDLPDEVPIRTFQSKAAVYALKARIYLYQQDYDKAATYARQTLDEYSFLYNLNEVEQNHPVLPIAGLRGYNPNGYTSQESVYGMASSEGAHIFYDNDAYNEYADNDFRKKYFAQDPTMIGMPPVGHFYIVNMGYSADAALSVPEAILNYCEALMKKSSPDAATALEYLNTLRANRYETGATFDDSDVLASVMKERKLELRYSAMRWWDMKRLGVTVVREFEGETFTLTPESPNYVFAIPPKVMRLNDKLIQNERGL
ncbi:MAG: RagB/SusD family nutrient uptake outer membrane protein [Carboxylicivirga sp.]|jgi:tetratricopeptide (TPR) repeat protein|nr:RagB/SusD family nutrient uptake outer membrane protein [Carboxylicivirga sp.]